MKKGNLFVVSSIVMILLAGLISAAGVVQPYWNSGPSGQENPLFLMPRQSGVVNLTLQNTGTENLTFNATITSGNEIATMKQTVYNVSAGETHIIVPVQISVPSDAKMNSTYEVTVLFKEISSGSGKMVQLSSGFSASFPVIVGSQEQKNGSSATSSTPGWNPVVLWIILALIVLAIIAIIIAIVNKKKSSKK